MIRPPALPSQPPPPPRRGTSPLARPMSLLAATGWSFGATFAFVWLASLTLALRPEAENDLVNTFVCQVVAYMLALFAILRVHAPEASIRRLLGLRRTHVLFAPVAVGLGVAVQYPATFVHELIERRWPTPPDADQRMLELLTDPSGGKRLVVCAIVVALGPLVEETFFRGALFRPLLERHGVAAVVVGTALLFALAHPEWQLLAPIGLVGLALGALRAQSGSLWPGLLMHASFNGTTVVAMLSGARPEASAPLSAGAAGVGTLATLALLAVAARIARTEKAEQARADDLGR